MVSSVVLKDGLVVVHDTIILRDFDIDGKKSIKSNFYFLNNLILRPIETSGKKVARPTLES